MQSSMKMDRGNPWPNLAAYIEHISMTRLCSRERARQHLELTQSATDMIKLET